MVKKDKIRIEWSYDSAPEVVLGELTPPVTIGTAMGLIKPGPGDILCVREDAVAEPNGPSVAEGSVTWSRLPTSRPESILVPDSIDPSTIRMHVRSAHPPPTVTTSSSPPLPFYTAFDVKSAPSSFRYVQDCIHGQMRVHKDLFRFIDTPHFQRLRFLKQLGLLHFVFPSGVHTRFEHCIGTSHLSRSLAEQWLQHQPALRTHGLTDHMVFLLSAAALVHDLGHGPFSHTFDGAVLPGLGEKSWTHEEGSAMLLDDLCDRHGLLSCRDGGLSVVAGTAGSAATAGLDLVGVTGPRAADFEAGERPLLTPADVRLMKALILGEAPGGATHAAQHAADGSQGNAHSATCVTTTASATAARHRYIYEVVSNPTTGIDCDKLDYFRRDAYHLGIHTTFDSAALLRSSRVLPVDDAAGTPAVPGGTLVTSYLARNAHLVLDLFRTRFALHQSIYGHRVAIAVEDMIVDMLTAADQVYDFKAAIRDPRRFLTLTDAIYESIAYGTDPRLARATAVAERLAHRKLYRCVGELTLPWGPDSTNYRRERLRALSALKDGRRVTAEDIMRHAPNAAGVPAGRLDRAGAIGGGDGPGESGPSLGTGAGALGAASGAGGGLWSGSIFVSDRVMNYGNKAENPLKRCFFHNSSGDTHCTPYDRAEGVGVAHPQDFQERIIRVYAKHADVDTATLRAAFDSFVRLELGLYANVEPRVDVDSSLAAGQRVPDTPTRQAGGASDLFDNLRELSQSRSQRGIRRGEGEAPPAKRARDAL